MLSPFYLVGPTAVGKSSLAVEIAARCGAEIVGADAFQIYAGLDVLTAKPSPRERQRVPHHLVGTQPLAAEHNVARYLESARCCLDEIAARGKRALIVGGSGLYVRALTHGLSPLLPPRLERRAELDQMTLPDLVARVKELDPTAMKLIDIKNKRRLIRAIEICEGTGEPFSATRTLWNELSPVSAQQGILLTRDRPDLLRRIAHRVTKLVPNGVLAEVGAEAETVFSSTAARVIGLDALRAHLRGELDLPTCLQSIEVATRQYAKRQLTWFRGKSDFKPVNLSPMSDEQVIDLALKRIQETDPE